MKKYRILKREQETPISLSYLKMELKYKFRCKNGGN